MRFRGNVLRSLHGRLSLALLALFIPVRVFYVLSTVATSRRYAQEVSQEVNAGLAARLVQDAELMVGRDVAVGALEAIVETLARRTPTSTCTCSARTVRS